MRKYEIIRSEIGSMHNKSHLKEIFSSILTIPSRPASVFLKIDLPEYEVLRSQIFLEDLSEQLEDGIELSIVDLLSLLLKDFLYVASTTTKMENLKDSLLEKKQQFLAKTERVEEFVEVSPGHSTLRVRDKPRRVRYYTLELTIPRKTALRLEIVLYDLEQLFKSFQMSLEELISIVFLEFVHYLKIGKQKDMVKRFIQRFG